MHAEFFLVGIKRNETKVVEEYGWAITLAAGRTCCGRSVSSVLESGFAWTPLYIHTLYS
jgi:hypothetical protein